MYMCNQRTHLDAELPVVERPVAGQLVGDLSVQVSSMDTRATYSSGHSHLWNKKCDPVEAAALSSSRQTVLILCKAVTAGTVWLHPSAYAPSAYAL
jgi:hypothetical protein